MRRRWSSRWRRGDSSQHAATVGCAASLMNHEKQPFSESRLNCLSPANRMSNPTSRRVIHAASKYDANGFSPPDSASIRTACNSEALVHEQKQCTLESKVEGSPLNHATGGTLKIYGGDICPAAPYRTLLLSSTDRVDQAVRQCLDKFNLEKADSTYYCLVMRTRSNLEVISGLPGCEVVLSDDDCLLGRLFSWTSSLEPGSVVTFELQHRRVHVPHRRPFSSGLSVTTSSSNNSQSSGVPRQPVPFLDHPQFVSASSSCGPLTTPSTSARLSSLPSPSVSAVGLQSSPAAVHHQYSPTGGAPASSRCSLACLVEVGSTKHSVQTLGVHPLPVHSGEVCVGSATRPDREHPLLVSLSGSAWPEVELHHLLIWRPTGQVANCNLSSFPDLGWLACRPCVSAHCTNRRPILSQLPLCVVYINSRLLTASPHNQAAVHWLAPGDLIRFGHKTDRELQIWPSYTHGTSEPMHQLIGSDSGARSLVEDQSDSFAYLSPLVQNSSPQTFIGPFSPAFYRSPIASVSSSLTNHVSCNGQQLVSGRSSTATVAANDQSNTSPSSTYTSSSSSLSGVGQQRAASYQPTPTSSIVKNAREPRGWDSYSSADTINAVAKPSPPYSEVNHPTPPANTDKLHRLNAHVKPASPFHPIPGSQTTNLAHQVALSYANSYAPMEVACRTSNSSRSSHRSPKSSSYSTVSDRLPCQLAFAPGSIKSLLDWVITGHLQQPTCRPLDSTIGAPCPLGSALTVYLMLRAIHRQCDRWEIMETKRRTAVTTSNGKDSLQSSNGQSAASSTSLSVHQLHRRQRELLTLLVGAVERFQHFEFWLTGRIKLESSDAKPAKPAEPSPAATSDDAVQSCPPSFISIMASIATWLANASQLLHLASRDTDLARTFQTEPDADSEARACSSVDPEDQAVRTAWNFVLDQLADLVQLAFGMLTEVCSSRLDQTCISHLLDRLTSAVQKSTAAEIIFTEPDRLIPFLADCLGSLHRAQVNPAFTVQLFARLLHRLNARVFNLLLDQQVLSPTWGRVLNYWLRNELLPWATATGLSSAVDCYLIRVSQAAELLVTDMSCVESLYNIVVDLVGLNSRQVRTLLEAYRFYSYADPGKNQDTSTELAEVSKQWIDFVVSGVQLVADRILADQQKEGEQNEGDGLEDEDAHAQDHGELPAGVPSIWDPQLHEPLDLKLPLLLPEDGFATDTALTSETISTDDPHSCDSGISSRPSSARGVSNGGGGPNRPESAPIITVDSLRTFLDVPIKSSWCRLSVRPLPPPPTDGHTSASKVLHSSWSAYLNMQDPSVPMLSLSTSMELAARLSIGQGKVDRDGGDQINHTSHQTFNSRGHLSEVKPDASSKQMSRNNVVPSLSAIPLSQRQFCPNHQPLTIIVPKIGKSLGLSIVAAKSEDNQDLGIFIRGIVPDGGASQAYLADESSSEGTLVDQLGQSDRQLLLPGDHLLAVDGHPVTGLSQEAAAQLVASSGHQVRLTVVRHSVQPKFSVNQSTSLTCPECQLRSSFGDTSLLQLKVDNDWTVTSPFGCVLKPVGMSRLVDSAVQTHTTLASVPGGPSHTGCFSTDLHAVPTGVCSPTLSRSLRGSSLPPTSMAATTEARGVDNVHQRQRSDDIMSASTTSYHQRDGQLEATNAIIKPGHSDNVNQTVSPLSTSQLRGPNERCHGTGQINSVIHSSSRSPPSPVHKSDSASRHPQGNCYRSEQTHIDNSPVYKPVSSAICNATCKQLLTFGSKPPEVFVPTASVLPCGESRALVLQHHKCSKVWLEAFKTRARSSRSLNDLRPVPNIAYLPGYYHLQTTSSRVSGDSCSLTSRRTALTSGGGPRNLGASRSLQRRHTLGPACSSLLANFYNIGPRPEPPNHLTASGQTIQQN